ncbi:E3 ubiquitin-protein ligase znrf3 [Ataeniobius toweri]|uniref:E3 ubiquitin-protein ligase znrf3 n=1 Tax=Ataeniobius toweri TaxID=208326 RepID=A0ABU7AKR5_9TELE|nr:E3 ubiquitin-protein ligase znrf3 [Ataeniobius toweri]
MMIFLRRGSDRLPDSVVLVIWLLAASLDAVLAKDTAFVEVVLFESSPNGDYTTYTTGLQGRFSKAGATISAEGEIVQVRVEVFFYYKANISPGQHQNRAVTPPSCPL